MEHNEINWAIFNITRHLKKTIFLPLPSKRRDTIQNVFFLAYIYVV